MLCRDADSLVIAGGGAVLCWSSRGIVIFIDIVIVVAIVVFGWP
jgi:hypothetical protein